MAKRTPAAKWLTEKFLDWQKSQGELKTASEFAQYVGVGQSIMSKWLNGERTPTGLYVRQLALKLGNEIYDVLGVSQPQRDEQLERVLAYFNSFSEAEKAEAEAMLKQMASGKAAHAPVRGVVKSAKPATL